MFIIKVGEKYLSERDYGWLVEVNSIEDATEFSSDQADDIIKNIKEGTKIKKKTEVNNMSNTITNTLPPSLDAFLMDMAQTNEIVDIDYNDISEFGKRATPEDIKRLKNLKRKYYYHFNEDEETEKEIQISLEIRNLIKSSN